MQKFAFLGGNFTSGVVLRDINSEYCRFRCYLVAQEEFLDSFDPDEINSKRTSNIKT
jgi:hypothetical protein